MKKRWLCTLLLTALIVQLFAFGAGAESREVPEAAAGTAQGEQLLAVGYEMSLQLPDGQEPETFFGFVALYDESGKLLCIRQPDRFEELYDGRMTAHFTVEYQLYASCRRVLFYSIDGTTYAPVSERTELPRG